MKKAKIIIPLTALAILITAGSAYALSPERKAEHKANKAEIKTALENNDYPAWQELMSNHPKALEKINEENFTKLVEAHDLMISGDKEGARAIMDKLGVGKMGMKFGKRVVNYEARIAIENNDYTAWQEAVVGRPIAEKVTEDDFAKMVEIHKLRASGDYEAAQALKKELRSSRK